MDKLPPHDIDAEEALLGSLLIDEHSIRKIINGLRQDDFYSERNRWIYESCCNLYERREAISQITVAQDLARQDKLENCGGASFLSHLISVCPTSLDIEYYAGIIYRLSVSRRLISTSEQLAQIGYESLPNANETINKAIELVEAYRKNNAILGNSVITPLKAANDLFELVQRYKDPPNYPKWGFVDLDDITGGIPPEYIVIAGRPSMGKSQLALDVAENLNWQGKTILLASAEMADMQIYERKLASVTGLSILDIRKYGISDEHEKTLMDAVGQMSESKLHYIAGKLTLNDIYREVSNILSKGDGKLDGVIVDYLGALQDCYTDGRDNQNVKIGKISNRFQSMTHEFSIPFFVLSQLNRELEHRADPHPQLSDLRDSGSIEQDADVVLLIHRDRLEDMSLSNILEVYMAKNRQLGAHPPIRLQFDDKLKRYVNLARDYQIPEYQEQF